VGKTRLALRLAQQFHGEIVNADSRQVYRYMDIGTAKPTPEERRQVPHHLLDILDPDQNFDLGSFLSLARNIIQEVQGRGHLAIVVGGSGQYVWALLEGWQVPQVPPDSAFRRSKLREVEGAGALALYRELQAIDPQRAAELDPRNVRRVIRALEIYHVTRQPPSHYRQHQMLMADTLMVGLTLDRVELYRRIDARVDRMVADGLVDEARRLSDMGYQLGHGPLGSLGYLEMGLYLAGHVTLAEAVQQTRFQTHRLARRQYTWFKLGDPRIHWLDAADPHLDQRASDLVTSFLSASSLWYNKRATCPGECQ
jgi:tRNA dimethylallyltransferase